MQLYNSDLYCSIDEPPLQQYPLPYRYSANGSRTTGSLARVPFLITLTNSINSAVHRDWNLCFASCTATTTMTTTTTIHGQSVSECGTSRIDCLTHYRDIQQMYRHWIPLLLISAINPQLKFPFICSNPDHQHYLLCRRDFEQKSSFFLIYHYGRLH